MTKKQIAAKLDQAQPSFNYSVEKGITSYHNYTKKELIETAIRFGISLS
jgi:hypothetical protein